MMEREEVGRVLEMYFKGDREQDHADLAGYATGSLEAGEIAAVEAHLSECSLCAEAIAAYGEIEDLWPGNVARLRFARRHKTFWLGSVFAVAAAACVALALWVAPWSRSPSSFQDLDPGSPSRLVPKGRFALHVGVEREGKKFNLSPGDKLVTGDRLGFFYDAPLDGHLVILYGDETGAFVQLHPARDNRAARAKAGALVRIEDGAMLSPGRGCEWIVGFFSARRFDSSAARELAQRMWRGRQGCLLAEIRPPGIEIDALEVHR